MQKGRPGEGGTGAKKVVAQAAHVPHTSATATPAPVGIVLDDEEGDDEEGGGEKKPKKVVYASKTKQQLARKKEEEEAKKKVGAGVCVCVQSEECVW